MNMTSSRLYLRLLGYVKPYWRAFAASMLATAVSAATEPLLPALLKPLLDGTFVHKDDAVIRWAPLLILVIFFVRGVSSFVGSYAIGWVGNKVVMDLRDAMFRKLLALPTRFYDDHATGNLISKLTFDVTQVTAAATNVVTVSLRDSIVIAGLLGWLFYLNWKLTLLSLVMVPIIALIIRTLNIRLRNASRDSQRAMGDTTQVIEESVTAHKVVKLFGGQQYEDRRFNERTNQVRRHIMKQTAAAAANVPIVQMVAAAALSVIIYIATVQSRSDETTVGGFLSFITAMLMLTAPLKRLTGVSEFMQRGLAASESVFDLLDTPGETDTGKTAIGRAEGHIVFEHVSLSYRDDDRLAWPACARTSRWSARKWCCSTIPLPPTSPTARCAWCPKRKSSPPHRLRMRWNSSAICRRVCRRWWVKKACACPAGSASASPSPAPFSKMRPSSSWTKPPLRWIRNPNATSRLRWRP
jgi:subfamily B ATP-binding cassette protein MsbA